MAETQLNATAFTASSTIITGGNCTVQKDVILQYKDNTTGEYKKIPTSKIKKITIKGIPSSGTPSIGLHVQGMNSETGSIYPGTTSNHNSGFTYDKDDDPNSLFAGLNLPECDMLRIYGWFSGCTYNASNYFKASVEVIIYWTDPASEAMLTISSTSYMINGTLNFTISNRAAGSFHMIRIEKGEKTNREFTSEEVNIDGLQKTYYRDDDKPVGTAGWTFPKTKTTSGNNTTVAFKWDDRTNTKKATFILYIHFKTWKTKASYNNNEDPIQDEYYSVNGKEALQITIPAGNKTMTTSNVTFSVTRKYTGVDTYGAYVQNRSVVSINANAVGAYGSQVSLYVKEGAQSIASQAKANASITKDKIVTDKGNVVYKLTAMDSVGNSVVKTETINVKEYNPVSIIEYLPKRYTTSGNENKTSQHFVLAATPLSYTHENGQSIRNTVNVKLEVKIHGADDSTYENRISYFFNGNTYSYTVNDNNKTLTVNKNSTSKDLLLNGEADNDNNNNNAKTRSYDYRLTVEDIFSSISRTFVIGPASIFMRWDKTRNAFGFGTYPTTNNSLAIAEDWTFTHGSEAFKSNSGSPYFWQGVPMGAGALGSEQNGIDISLAGYNTSSNHRKLEWEEYKQSGNYFYVNSSDPTKIYCSIPCVVDINYKVLFRNDFSPSATYHTRLMKNTTMLTGSFHLSPASSEETCLFNYQYESMPFTIIMNNGDYFVIEVYGANNKAAQGNLYYTKNLRTIMVNISVKAKE